MRDRVEIVQADITQQNVDAIINAANTSLLGGGGVDGAIHRTAGPGLVQECRRLNGCPTGGAKLTAGYHLPARHVIHAVGPIWRDGTQGEAELLAKAYRNCFSLIREHALTSAAFPSISTGAYRFPIDQACRIALTESSRALRPPPLLRRLIFVCFDEATRTAYRHALPDILPVD
jgi:O-acetyl-ADP-ribose deacetylase